ncbi:MAG: hypothetical protein CL868_03315 [Cytophagaceae bacterium]|nr:hypothetical protein [Cytophagaceae bacterium]|tara:strand:- start:3420 stop:3767 length:348 start_codon:yes stop_codon:yes gene_type:complete
MKATLLFIAMFVAGLSFSQDSTGIDPGNSTQVAQQETVVKIYPNPVKDRIYFQTKGENRNFAVSIHDVLGKLVKKENLTTSSIRNGMDVSNLRRGVYLVQIDDGKSSHTQKMIKN